MTVWSLATQRIDDCEIDVSLYLTERQAYEALAWIMTEPEDKETRTTLLLLVHGNHGPIQQPVIDAFDAALSEAQWIGRIARHDHPWVFAEAA